MTFISSDGGGREGPSKYLVSTVIHELQHMLSGTTKHTGRYSAATWLEEGQAVTSEDIVTPDIHASAYNKVSNVPGVTGSRAGNYMAYGGQLSWSGWESLRSASGYDYSGAWGAFVNRTLGLGVFKYVASGKCKTDGHLDSGVAQRKCYKQGVKEEGAKGFTDTLGRMGISLWGNIPPDIAPPYLGFPARNHPKDEMGIPFAFTLPKVDFTPMARELASGHNAAKLKGLAQWFKRIDVAGNDITQTGIKIPKDHILFVLMRNEPAM